MNKKLADIIDVGFLILLAINVCVSAFLFNFWWGVTFTGITIWLGCTETGSKIRQKLTLTQKFKRSEWDWKKIYFFVSLQVFWAYLNLHLILKFWIWA